ncbi:DoxX family protein [Corallococcus sp. H22C18031201]|uniref:DoxX family protein n=1 Tax=Citreicoccus inhibens TaxID=2849499 RepID=UPI000E71AF1B|nr:DoxX family protein [Citreicoccus inhibens]MBU8894058.1 DoxX family protein [Citreicoccus inhibens]RJS23365.1 DoxX family protein [Corallococcus sp. H22C18031201]
MKLSSVFPAPPSNAASVALLMLRVVAGLAFVLHGSSKIQDPFHWMGPTAPVPGLFQALAALSEFGGGLAWILGALVPLASLGLFFTMLVAVFTHAVANGDPFVGHGASYELALVYLSISVVMLLIGPGRFSVDAFIRARLNRTP